MGGAAGASPRPQTPPLGIVRAQPDRRSTMSIRDDDNLDDYHGAEGDVVAEGTG